MRTLAALGWCLMTLVGCAESVEPETTALSPGVTYELVWFAGDAVDEGSGAWSVTTALGYEVEVSRELLTISTVQMTPCDDLARSSDAPGLLWLVDAALGVTPAFAGHGALEADPSAVLDEQLETLAPGVTTVFGPSAMADHDYCGLHVLFGPSAAEASRSGVNMHLHVLHIDGAWREGEGGWTPFEVHTTLPTGALVDLEDFDGSARPISAGSRAAVVRVERELGHLFDAVDFQVASEDSRDKAILTAIADSVRATVSAVEAGSPEP